MKNLRHLMSHLLHVDDRSCAPNLTEKAMGSTLSDSTDWEDRIIGHVYEID